MKRQYQNHKAQDHRNNHLNQNKPLQHFIIGTHVHFGQSYQREHYYYAGNQQVEDEQGEEEEAGEGCGAPGYCHGDQVYQDEA